MQDEALYKCCLLLFDCHALEDGPRHEVGVGVGRNEPVAHDIVGPSARFSGVPTILLMTLLRHPHMCAWIDECVEVPFWLCYV